MFSLPLFHLKSDTSGTVIKVKHFHLRTIFLHLCVKLLKRSAPPSYPSCHLDRTHVLKGVMFMITSFLYIVRAHSINPASLITSSCGNVLWNLRVLDDRVAPRFWQNNASFHHAGHDSCKSPRRSSTDEHGFFTSVIYSRVELHHNWPSDDLLQEVTRGLLADTHFHYMRKKNKPQSTTCQQYTVSHGALQLQLQCINPQM